MKLANSSSSCLFEIARNKKIDDINNDTKTIHCNKKVMKFFLTQVFEFNKTIFCS